MSEKNESNTKLIDYFVDILQKKGVDAAFGVSGGFIVPFWEALTRSDIRVIHCRHEGGAAFAASEYSLETNRISVAFATSGPGISNALTGLKAAKLDGSKVIFFSAITTSQHDGLWGLQETTPEDVASLVGNYPSGFFSEIICVEHAEDFHSVVSAIDKIDTVQGGVLGIFISANIQKSFISSDIKVEIVSDLPASQNVITTNMQHNVAKKLSGKGALIWAGYGARSAAGILTSIAIETDTPVMATPRAKGVFPEKNSLYVGTTGLGSDAHKLLQIINSDDLKCVIIFGSRLGEFSSSYIQRRLKDIEVYYIGLEEGDASKNLPKNAIIINSEISEFLSGVKLSLSSFEKPESLSFFIDSSDDDYSKLQTQEGRIHPREVMRVIQEVAINGHDCTVAADAGNSFVWTNRYLKFSRPNQYRVSTALGAMAHYACGLIGLSASGKPAIAVVGDGAMLMNNEISTAVRYNLPAIWLVMNDSNYNMCRQGLELLDADPLDCEIPETDFALLGKSLGARGIHVASIKELEHALSESLSFPAPTVIDVLIDRTAVPPLQDRIETIRSLSV